MQPTAKTGPQEVIIEVDRLIKAYGKLTVLDGISFRLLSGEALGVLGPSGCGKSTLLKAIDALETFDAGSIKYFNTSEVAVVDGISTVTQAGTESSDRSEVFRSIRQDIGFVFQGLNLWEERTVMDNLVLAPTVVLNEPMETARDRASVLCDKFAMESKRDARVWELSGGQRQRVAIMRALMMRPKLMLLDEITSALDPMLVLDVMEAIRNLRADGMSFILVTHHVEFACSICHRIMFLQDGKIVQIGTPDELRSPRADSRVRKFCEMIRSTS